METLRSGQAQISILDSHEQCLTSAGDMVSNESDGANTTIGTPQSIEQMGPTCVASPWASRTPMEARPHHEDHVATTMAWYGMASVGQRRKVSRQTNRVIKGNEFSRGRTFGRESDCGAQPRCARRPGTRLVAGRWCGLAVGTSPDADGEIQWSSRRHGVHDGKMAACRVPFNAELHDAGHSSGRTRRGMKREDEVCFLKFYRRTHMTTRRTSASGGARCSSFNHDVRPSSREHNVVPCELLDK
ncbi:uncharacterized protein BDV17DRAFT_20734 [Aspergillus undulatus]|uniref:uncharacterized protein n=1 Tax=Aspergillus undulatus TaxID=1810928 RepID=UPI003CCDB012